MSEPTIHLVMVRPSSERDLWAVYSPQIAGFSAFRDTAEELSADMTSILDFAVGSERSSDSIARHTEFLIVIDDVEILVRIEVDEHRAFRTEVADRLIRAVNTTDQRLHLLQYPRRKTGEILFICAISEDLIAELAEQLEPAGDAAVILCAVAEENVWALTITNDDELMADTDPLDELETNPGMTVGQLMRTDSLPRGNRHVRIT